MLDSATVYLKPTSVSDALRLLRRRGGRAMPLAGGTRLLSQADPHVQAVVDLSDLGLDYVRNGAEYLEIGAMATLQTLATSPLLSSYASGLLASAAHDSATRTIRNAATLGGAIATRAPADDLLVALLALDAAAISATGAVMPLPDLLARKRWSRTMRLLVEARAPLACAGWAGAICRVARLPSDGAIVNVAAVLRLESGVCQDIRLAAGGVAATPIRLPIAEEALRGSHLLDQDLERAGEAQQRAVRPPNDYMGSAEYRRAMLGVLLRRALQTCVQSEESPWTSASRSTAHSVS